MLQDISLTVDGYSARNLLLLWNAKFHHHIHKKPATGLYPKPVQSSPQLHTPIL